MNDNFESIYDFDELKMFFGKDYWVTDKIKISQPTIGQIVDFGDADFYSVVNKLCANPTSYRLFLWKNGIDWNELTEYQLFCFLIKTITPDQSYLLFGDLNLSWFEVIHDSEKQADILIYVPRNENGEIQNFDYDEAIIIDEFVYTKIVNYIRCMFNIYPKVERAKNKATKEAMIWEEEEKLKLQELKKEKEDRKKSFLLPLISSLVNHPGFKYKTNELEDIGIVQFMDSVKRLSIYENAIALLHGSFSGTIDVSGIDKSAFDWMRDLNK